MPAPEVTSDPRSLRGTPSVRWGPLVSAGCFALLSAFRFADGAIGWATLFVVIALLNLLVALRTAARGGSGAGRHAAAAAASQRPTGSQLQRTHDVYDARRRSWLWTAAGGFVLAAPATFVFPPMSLVLAALSLFAVARYRQYRRSTRTLERLLSSGGTGS